MEKPMTLCDRCEKAFSCLLNYDGVPCRKNRTVEPTNYDRIISKTPEELAEFLQKNRGGCRALTTESYVCGFYTDDLNTDCKACWLDWLKQEADK